MTMRFLIVCLWLTRSAALMKPLETQAARSTASAKIPKLVHLTALEYPEAVVSNNRFYMEPGTEFIFYNNSMMDDSVREISAALEVHENLTGAYEAFSNLRPMAFRADLWRYMILWHRGGIYMDDKLMLTGKTDAWLDRYNDELITVKDRFQDHGSGRDIYWNGFLASAPKNRVLVDVIRHVVGNIQKQTYEDAGGDSNWCLYITGPGALTKGLGSFKPALPLTLKRTEDEKGVDSTWHTVKGDPGGHVLGIGRLTLKVPYIVYTPPQRTEMLVRGGAKDGKGNLEAELEFHGADGSTLMISNAGVHHDSGASLYAQLCRQHMVYCNEPVAGLDPDRNPCTWAQELAGLDPDS